jgi:addiction module HigA family antidote
MTEDHQHPGEYIRAEVIPPGMSVKKAAEMLGIGRPALSNLLNGKAALSPEMALRLEKAFGVERDLLLEKQRTFDDRQNRDREKEVAVKTYAPSFLDITATQIDAWADKNEARPQLAALLRKLVKTTGVNLSKADFPAYDNSERHGWDGQVETDTATPWIPSGTSGWEFGCNQNPKQKADDDYDARVKSVRAAERKRITFVFATPRNWPGKDTWAKEKASERRWKDVKAFDASDIEQWLEASVPAQCWLAERLGIVPDDMLSLEECWDRWSKATKPELGKELFAGSVAAHRDSLSRWLENPPERPFVVTSESEEETLAYLACALDPDGSGTSDNAVVLRSVLGFRRATKSSSSFIAILVSPDVEAASAGLHQRQHTIIVRARNAVQSQPDAALDLVDDETFRKGLAQMRVPEDDVPALSRASCQSLTILRRRLAVVPAIQFPPWAEDTALTRKLIPMGLVGAWDSGSKEDREILSRLVDDKYDAIEKYVAELRNCEHPPVWVSGRHRGVASKLDVLHATRRFMTPVDLENFFLTARIVLSERDPALDLPEKKRYLADLYGKSRDHSPALRDGMCETLVLLSVHGPNLYRDLGFDVEGYVQRTVRELLTPAAAETWASQKGDLPLYAEAAPDLFLDVVEADLRSEEPKILSLLKPASSEFFGGGCPRSGLLWALELLAWKPERMPRVAAVLARMSTIRIDDNWINKPESSLKAIFRWWMPQTAADVAQRCAVLENLARRHPAVGWRLCLDQIEASGTGGFSHRPRWRKDADGVGQPAGSEENFVFARKALDLAIDWPSHNEHTLGDLVGEIHGLDESIQERIWDRIRAWIATGPTDEAKATLRETIRTRAFTRRVRAKRGSTPDAARALYDELRPADPVVRHRWLFAQNWVQESPQEIDLENFDHQKYEQKIQKLRDAAVAEIWGAGSYAGMIKLCESGEGSHVVGWSLAGLAPPDLDPVRLAVELIAEENSAHAAQFNGCLGGFLLRLDDARRGDLLDALISRLNAEQRNHEDRIVRVLKCAPFKPSTWKIVDGLPEQQRSRYWAEVSPNWMIGDQDEARDLVERLLNARRPQAAFAAVRLQIEKLDSPSIVRLLKDVATTTSKTDAKMRFNSFDFARAFQVIDSRADVPADDLAHLEFLYLSALRHEKRGIPNLQRRIAENPALFVQAVGLVYKRKGDGEDPPEWNIADDKARANIADQAYSLLHAAKRIPGTGDDGKINAAQLKAWIVEVRAQCKSHGRELAGDNSIGELLSKSGRDPDGMWPATAVRDALEEVGNERIAEGMSVGLYNQRGAHWRGVGGQQERDLAAMYRGWSKQMAVEWPFTSRLLERIASSYDRDAKYHDDDADLRRRLPR